MSLAKKSFVTAVVAPVALAAFGLAAANDAQAEVTIGCRKPEAVPSLQQQVLKEEGMVPVAARPGAITDDKGNVTEWVQETIMMNPQNRTGLLWEKTSNGTVCILKTYSEMEIFNHKSFDGRALMSVSGKDPKQVEINSTLAGLSMKMGENPMFRAIAYVPTNAAAKDPVNVPTRFVEYMVANPNTTKGSMLAVNFEGNEIKRFARFYPSPAEKPVKYGAIFTPVGEDLLKGSRVASAGMTETLALNKN